MIQINLLPDIKREYLRARRMQARVISVSILAALIAIGLMVLLALWTYGIQNIHRNILSVQIDKYQVQIEGTKDVQKYVTVQNQLASLGKLHDEKNDYSRLFGFLPVLNPKAPNSVRFTSVDLNDETHMMTVSGETRDFTGLVTLRDMMTNARLSYKQGSDISQKPTETMLFSEVRVDEQQLSKDSAGDSLVTFKITATYMKEAFVNSTSEVIVSIPKLETTPSKQDSPGVFADSTATESERGN